MLQTTKKPMKLALTIIGDVKGKDVVIIDDMIDTAETLTKSAQLFYRTWSKSRICTCCTHALLSGPAHERNLKTVY